MTSATTRALLCAMGLLAFSPDLARSWTGPANGTVVHIQSLVVLADGGFYIHADQALCSGGQAVRVGYVRANNAAMPTQTVQATDAGRNQLFAVLLAAATARRAVRVYVDEPTATAWGCVLGAATLAD